MTLELTQDEFTALFSKAVEKCWISASKRKSSIADSDFRQVLKVKYSVMTSDLHTK